MLDERKASSMTALRGAAGGREAIIDKTFRSPKLAAKR